MRAPGALGTAGRRDRPWWLHTMKHSGSPFPGAERPGSVSGLRSNGHVRWQVTGGDSLWGLSSRQTPPTWGDRACTSARGARRGHGSTAHTPQSDPGGPAVPRPVLPRYQLGALRFNSALTRSCLPGDTHRSRARSHGAGPPHPGAPGFSWRLQATASHDPLLSSHDLLEPVTTSGKHCTY